MKAKTFENLIRKIVREEIDYALRREIRSLKEDLRDEIKPVITEQPITPVPNKVKNSLKEKIMGKSPLKNIPKKNFVKNSTLNDLLNDRYNEVYNKLQESGNKKALKRVFTLKENLEEDYNISSKIINTNDTSPKSSNNSNRS